MIPLEKNWALNGMNLYVWYPFSNHIENYGAYKRKGEKWVKREIDTERDRDRKRVKKRETESERESVCPRGQQEERQGLGWEEIGT